MGPVGGVGIGVLGGPGVGLPGDGGAGVGLLGNPGGKVMPPTGKIGTTGGTKKIPGLADGNQISVGGAWRQNRPYKKTFQR
jgi:hypothetical protein